MFSLYSRKVSSSFFTAHQYNFLYSDPYVFFSCRLAAPLTSVLLYCLQSGNVMYMSRSPFIWYVFPSGVHVTDRTVLVHSVSSLWFFKYQYGLSNEQCRKFYSSSKSSFMPLVSILSLVTALRLLLPTLEPWVFSGNTFPLLNCHSLFCPSCRIVLVLTQFSRYCFPSYQSRLMRPHVLRFRLIEHYSNRR